MCLLGEQTLRRTTVPRAHAQREQSTSSSLYVLNENRSDSGNVPVVDSLGWALEALSNAHQTRLHGLDGCPVACLDSHSLTRPSTASRMLPAGSETEITIS